MRWKKERLNTDRGTLCLLWSGDRQPAYSLLQPFTNSLRYQLLCSFASKR